MNLASKRLLNLVPFECMVKYPDSVSNLWCITPANQLDQYSSCFISKDLNAYKELTNEK